MVKKKVDVSDKEDRKKFDVTKQVLINNITKCTNINQLRQTVLLHWGLFMLADGIVDSIVTDQKPKDVKRKTVS